MQEVKPEDIDPEAPEEPPPVAPVVPLDPEVWAMATDASNSADALDPSR